MAKRALKKGDSILIKKSLPFPAWPDFTIVTGRIEAMDDKTATIAYKFEDEFERVLKKTRTVSIEALNRGMLNL